MMHRRRRTRSCMPASDKRVALVTGAARGIGAAIAERLASDGMCVGVADVDEPATRGHVERMRARGRGAFAVHLDVSDPQSSVEAVDAVLQREGQLDVLVNNAGIAGRAAAVVDYPLDE